MTTLSLAMPNFRADTVEDALVGLMRHEPVDVGDGHAGASSVSSITSEMIGDGMAEHFLALHPQHADRLVVDGPPST